MIQRVNVSRLRWLAALSAIFLGVGLATSAQAVVISSQLGNTPSGTALYYGQGVTTGSGTFWDNIRFSFDSESGAGTTNYAEGDLFLLSNAYAGSPLGLSSATTGFIAQSTGIVGGQWVFDSSVILAATTTYYFFMGDRPSATSTTIYGAFNNSSPGLFSANCSSCTYFGNTNDFDHILEGNAVPEPTTLLLLGLGLAGLGVARRRLH